MSEGPRWRMLAPFGIRSYRFQWPADLATSWAFEMETLALGWYILAETGSVLLLTVFASLQFLGTLVAPAFGLAGDRIGHRNLLCMMRGVYLLLAALLGLLAFAGLLGPVQVLAVATLGGIVRPSDLSIRNVLISETMPTDRLMGAISLSRITADSARIVGALAGAGVVAALGLGWAYAMITALYAASLLLSLGIEARGEARAGGAARGSPWRELRQAASAVWDAPPQLAALILAFLVNLTAYPFLIGLLPYVAREVYGTDQTGLGYLVASAAAGAVAASALLSYLERVVLPGRWMITFSLAWHALILAFAHTTTMPQGVGVLLLAGLAQGLCITPMAVLLLRNAPPALRGRIMGLRTLAVYGLPIGLLAAGPLLDRAGFVATATLYGAAGLCCTLLILLRWRDHLWPPGAPANGG